MKSSRSQQPMNWEDYEAGISPRQGSTGSLGSHVQFDAPSTPPGASKRLNVPQHRANGEQAGGSLRHRTSRSSISSKINTIAQAGGLNSFENFARSWSRAAAFHDIPQRRPSFMVSEDEDESVGSKIAGEYPCAPEPRSLLKQQLEDQGNLSEDVIEEGPSTYKEDEESQTFLSAAQKSSFSDRAPVFPSPFGSSFGGVYGSLPSHRGDSLMRPSMRRGEERLEDTKVLVDDQAPLLIKVIGRCDGKKIQVVIGQSTLPQTIFNSVNTLIGIGLLSLPLALKQSGLVIGMVFLLLAALVTRYTARLLAKCLDLDQSLVTFSDIAWKAFGLKARIAVGLLFSLELLGACIALVILFADSLDALIPGYGITEWKAICGLILLPLNLVPLRYLSFTSVLGILCCLGILSLTFVDGIIKHHTPGSLREPATVSLFPIRWSDVPLSFGLLMAPWGGHGVFPNIYRDMRHPTKYNRAVSCTYVFTYLIDIAIAITGYLMFGQAVRDEVTSNILMTTGYPHAISICIVACIAIIPLTKVPLNARPIFLIIEDLVGMKNDSSSTSKLIASSGSRRAVLGMIVRIFVLVLIVFLAIVVPSFDAIMGLLGAALSFSICIIFPVAFHLELFRKELGKMEVALNWFLLITCSVLAVISTVWIFLPRSST